MQPNPGSRHRALLPVGLLVLLVSILGLFFCRYGLALDVPALTGRIVDLAHILPADLAASLSSELAMHEQLTGNQVVLLTIPSLEGESLEEFSHRVATTWKLGQKGRDNGVLLLVVTGERRIRIEVGYGLEGKLTDAQASRIIRREMVPRFRAGDYAGGAAEGLRAVMGTIEGTYSAETSPDQADWPGTLFLGAASGAVIGGLFGIHWLLRGAGLGGLISFLFGLSGGLLIAAAAGVLGFIGALFVSALLRIAGQDVRGRRRRGWSDSGWSTGGSFGGGDFGGGSESFSGGGGDFGGGGASGRW